jgi:hypothetical protein
MLEFLIENIVVEFEGTFFNILLACWSSSKLLWGWVYTKTSLWNKGNKEVLLSNIKYKNVCKSSYSSLIGIFIDDMNDFSLAKISSLSKLVFLYRVVENTKLFD